MTNHIISQTLFEYFESNSKLRGRSIEEKLDYYSIPVTESGCFIWIGHVNRSGYGTIYYKGGCRLAHRVAYEINYGELGNKCALHKCDNRRCINPAHLFSGTNLDNILDKVAKGRANGLKGSANPNSKLTNEDVKYIRRSKERSYEIAKKLNISLVTVSRVKNFHSWKI